MLKNIIPLQKLVEKAKEGEYDFLALSDTNNLHALVELSKLCQKNGIKPIYGMAITVSYNLDETDFLIYAKNTEGFKELLTITKIIQTQTKLIDIDEFIKYTDNLIVISAGYDSIIDKDLLNNNTQKAKADILFFKEKIKNFYIGFSLQNFDHEMSYSSDLIKLSRNLNCPVLPVNKTSYLNKRDRQTLEYLIKIEDENNSLNVDTDYSFKTKKELLKRYSDYLFVFKNATSVVNEISFSLDKPALTLPVYQKKNSASSKEYLEALAAVGLKKRLKNKKIDFKIYDQRLRHELKVINDMGFNDYFLIVYDFVYFAKKEGIIVGPGRGSAAGSLVSYALGITEIDPIEYDLLFERFLNPERKSMPDIDMDFPDDKRDYVINYVKEKYGMNHICSISTFSTFGFKQAIRDIARIMKIDSNRLSGIIKRYDRNELDESDELSLTLIDIAKKIEGLPRHIGTHAAGIILSNQDLTKLIPLQKGAYDFYQSQLEASDLEYLGFLKIDFLGIRNLTIIDKVLKQTNIKLETIPLDDEKVFTMLKNGDTTGIFQLESMGMRNVLRKMQVSSFEDIVAVLALYRPGPMDNIDEYIERKNGKKYEYVHPDLEPILKKTYGVLIYQEQIMSICVSFANYSLAEADLLRRAVSKKDRHLLETERANFTEKCVSKGYTIEVAEKIYEYILRFANYGFNRSHSVAYALVAYQMAYLKVNYYQIFMAVLMSSVIGNESLTFDYIKEMRKNGYTIKGPNINVSSFEYIIKDNEIYYPIIGIKGIGKEITTKIIAERENGLFTDYSNFKTRVSSFINKKALEQLIYSGALDVFGLNQNTLINHSEITELNLASYFEGAIFKEYPDFTVRKKIENEKNAIGFNLTYNPIAIYDKILSGGKVRTIGEINDGESKVLGFIEKVKKIQTKTKEEMAFIKITDAMNELEIVAFPLTFKRIKNLLDSDDVRIFTIKKEKRGNDVSYILENVEVLNEIAN